MGAFAHVETQTHNGHEWSPAGEGAQVEAWEADFLRDVLQIRQLKAELTAAMHKVSIILRKRNGKKTNNKNKTQNKENKRKQKKTKEKKKTTPFVVNLTLFLFCLFYTTQSMDPAGSIVLLTISSPCSQWSIAHVDNASARVANLPLEKARRLLAILWHVNNLHAAAVSGNCN